MKRGKVFIAKSHEAVQQDFPALVIGKVLAICFPGTVCTDCVPDADAGGTWYYLEGGEMPVFIPGGTTKPVDEPAGLMDALYRRRGLDAEGKPL